MAWYESGKKKIASESIRISAQMESTFRQAETAPLLSSLLHDSQGNMCFLVWASWGGDGFDSLEAEGQIPLCCALVEIGSEGVGVNWSVLVFPCSNWELN